MPTDPRIKAELKKLKKLCENLPVNHSALVEKLIHNAAFMGVLLEDLREDIRVNGFYEIYQHGANQSGKKRSVAADLYQVQVKNYAAVIRQLTDLLPPGEDPDIGGLMAFINSRDR